MTTQQRHTELNEQIETSGIYQAIKALETNLQNYKKSKRIGENRYAIQQELDRIGLEVLNLKGILEEAVNQSILWEALE